MIGYAANTMVSITIAYGGQPPPDLQKFIEILKITPSILLALYMLLVGSLFIYVVYFRKKPEEEEEREIYSFYQQ